ncbi:MAG: 2-C-methyl-D-erythritol 4-phosphate cytidylyltransferase [Solirubrobacterales bacterium]
MGAAALATALIAAAGSGERLGAGRPKALVEIAGRPLLAWSLAAVGGARSVGAVVVVAPPGYEEDVRAIAAGAQVVTGGASRSESVANALREVEGELVAVHDAARPLATSELFDAVISELAGDPDCAALIAAAPIADTVKRALGGRVIETVPRSELWAVQTPQAFRVEALRGALDTDPETLAGATDDASLVEAAGGVVRLHPVSAPNPKLTTESDLSAIEAILRDRTSS